MKTSFLALATSIVWASLTAADPPPPYPRVSTSISIHPDSVPVLPDPDYHTWVVEEGAGTSEFSIDGINFKLAAQDLDSNEALGSFVGGVNEEVYNVPAAPFGQRFVGAGITTVAAEGSFKLTISGLPDGQYWLSTWFNSWEEIERPGAVFVYKNGLGKGYVREQTSRAATVFEAAQDMVDVQGDTTEIVYQSYRRVRAGNIFLTGIEINGINPWMEVTYPVPATRETDVAAPNGELLVTWGYSRDLIFLESEEQIFNVYFGTSPDELDSVALEAEETEFLFTGLESGRTYYWRVDTQWSWEPWTPFFHGRTLEFTVA